MRYDMELQLISDSQLIYIPPTGRKAEKTCNTDISSFEEVEGRLKYRVQVQR